MDTCENLRPEFSAYLDNEVSPELRSAIEAHLDKCDKCRQEMKLLSNAWNIIGEYKIEPLTNEETQTWTTTFYKSTLHRSVVREKPTKSLGKFWAAVVGLLLAFIVSLLTRPSSHEEDLNLNLELELKQNLNLLRDPNFEIYEELSVLENFEALLNLKKILGKKHPR